MLHGSQVAEELILENFEAVIDFRLSVGDETDRGCALMAAEFLSNQLEELLRASFVEDKRACDSVFKGALGSFSRRIEVAYVLGLVSRDARKELDLVGQIRNKFAHSYKPLMFSHKEIADKCRELHCHVLTPDDDARTRFTGCVIGLLAVIHARLLSVQHAPPADVGPPKFSADEIHGLKKQFGELWKALAPGMQSDKLTPVESSE